MRQALRYAAALILAPIVGTILGFPFSIIIDVIWGADVTGGVWALSVPNVIFYSIGAGITGFAAGWIAGRRGILVAAISNFMPVFALVALEIAFNRLASSDSHLATRPGLWLWIGLVPCMAAGHLAEKAKPSGYSGLLTGLMAIFYVSAQLGAVVFHIYTTWLAYQIRGLLAAFITLGTPFIAELYWAWSIWEHTNAFWNIYTQRFVVLMVWWACSTALFVWVASRESVKRPPM